MHVSVAESPPIANKSKGGEGDDDLMRRTLTAGIDFPCVTRYLFVPTIKAYTITFFQPHTKT